MGEQKDISCLLSCFYKDSPDYLEIALKSIAEQTVCANEVVFVEDGQLTPGLYAVLNKYENILPLKRIALEENKGLGYVLNLGVKECANEIIIRMDADDICHPERFKKQYDFLMQNQQVDIVGTWAKDIDENGEVTGERKYPTSHQDLYKVIWCNPLIHPAIAFRKSSIEKIGSYDPQRVRRQDYELWMRAAAKGLIFANIPEFLLYYRFTKTTFKKNNYKVIWNQVLIGLKGLTKIKAPLSAYVMVCLPLVRTMLPVSVVSALHRKLDRFDPRKALKDI